MAGHGEDHEMEDLSQINMAERNEGQEVNVDDPHEGQEVDLSEVNMALMEATSCDCHRCPGDGRCPEPLSRRRRTKVKQRQFFGEFHAEGGADRREPEMPKSSLGVLNDKGTMDVPGSVRFLDEGTQNKPMGMENIPRRTSHSVFKAGYGSTAGVPENKRTKNGVVLVPQPEDTGNDPLNWPGWKRDGALTAVGLYCAVGGGMTPILAAGFTDVARDFGVSVEQVAKTTGFYMVGLGCGGVLWSPTAILYGKRPVYLASSVMFLVSNIWCAVASTFRSLNVARFFQGVALSPVECLPSATVAEIYFLHERAFRLGIYTLLLLGGKNLVPLLSAAIMGTLGWRWVFWIVAMFSVFAGTLLFFLAPETFWDRSPVPRAVIRERNVTNNDNFFSKYVGRGTTNQRADTSNDDGEGATRSMPGPSMPGPSMPGPSGSERLTRRDCTSHRPERAQVGPSHMMTQSENGIDPTTNFEGDGPHPGRQFMPKLMYGWEHRRGSSMPPGSMAPQKREWQPAVPSEWQQSEIAPWATKRIASRSSVSSAPVTMPTHEAYTSILRRRPTQPYVQQLKPYNGRLNPDKWLKVAVRPFILLSYPAVAFAALTYACSVGWLIVISESVSMIYRGGYYDFDAMHAGLVYIGPFIGGILGTAVAGKLSDVIVRFMARKNGGLYEPEFRLVMMLPVAVATGAGLIGFGWSAENRANWLVPTFFFSLCSFGCALGSTTSITFVVDSYRQYAGEALVTLNFCKNIGHGLVFSLFVTSWIEAAGSKTVFLWIGVMQVTATLFSIPMYIYGKRLRMWTVRKNFMERF